MKVVGIAVATVIAIALQTTLTRFLSGTVMVDLVLVVVVYAALLWGPAAGLLARRRGRYHLEACTARFT